MADEPRPEDDPRDPEHPIDDAEAGKSRRLHRQGERIRELERLMRAAAAFARGRPQGP